MANEENLIPLTTKRAREIGKIGGSVRSDRKKAAQKWLAYKKLLKLGKIDTVNPKWLMERVENDKAFAADMIKDIDKLEQNSSYPKDKLVFLKNQIYKSLHGTKISGEFKHQHDIRVVTYNISSPNDKYPRIEEEL